MKICAKCKEEKEFTEFYKNKTNKDGYFGHCKDCHNKTGREYSKKYRKNNKEQIKEKRIINYPRTRNLVNIYINKRREKDFLFKLNGNVRCLIRNSIKKRGYTKKSKSYKILGCTFEEFKEHLERQFTEGMTWKNQGKWHLDHIYPSSLAKDEEELLKLNHYTNFQPLWAIDNFKKGNKIIEKQLTLI
tara:strand:+ start:48 stop:611 length:564 start_codon:yes stop_codon:yes gene_type:complete